MNLTPPEPAGDPPEGWTGSRPEWSIYWALRTLHMEEHQDFWYRFNVAGIGASYYSQFDFVIPDYFTAIEVQGEFWHYAQGHTKIAEDRMRKVMAATHGFTLIFIDETDALARPTYMVEEALRGADHSKTGNS